MIGRSTHVAIAIAALLSGCDASVDVRSKPLDCEAIAADVEALADHLTVKGLESVPDCSGSSCTPASSCLARALVADDSNEVQMRAANALAQDIQTEYPMISRPPARAEDQIRGELTEMAINLGHDYGEASNQVSAVLDLVKSRFATTTENEPQAPKESPTPPRAQ